MATFKIQIEDITGSVGDDTALTQWLQDGTREIINILPPDLKETCYSKQTFTSAAANSEAETMITGQLGSVFAGSVECRKIRPMDKHKASDSSSLQYATSTDPIYYIEGGKINILPASSSGIYYVVANPTVAHGSNSIDNFPNEAEYLVVLYASIKGLQRLQNNLNSNSDITTAMSAVTTELNKVDDILNTAKTQVDAYYTSIGDIDDTTDIWDDTNKRFVYVRDALLKAQNLVDGPTMGGDTETESVQYWLNDEDSEMAQATMQAAQTELKRAEMSIAEINSIMNTYKIEVEGVAGYLNAAAGYVNQAQGYIAESTIRLQTDNQKYQWYQVQQVKLQQDYNQGIMMLVTGKLPEQRGIGDALLKELEKSKIAQKG